MELGSVRFVVPGIGGWGRSAVLGMVTSPTVTAVSHMAATNVGVFWK